MVGDFVVAGLDLRLSVDDLRHRLGDQDDPTQGMLRSAESDPGNYLMGALYVLSNIASRAARPGACPTDVLLFGVLAAFKNAHFPYRHLVWHGIDDHLARAFEHLRDVGPRGAARALIHDVLRRSRGDESDAPVCGGADRRSLEERASDEGRLTELNQRVFNAAKLLDPSMSFDDEFLRMLG